MKRRPRLLVALLAALLSLGACTLEDPQHNAFAELTYRHQPPITFNLGRIEVVEAYRPPLDSSHVEFLMPVRLGTSAKRWGQDRLRAQGSEHTLRYTVREASVIETKLETETGLTGLITVDQAERYDARLVIDVEIIDFVGQSLGKATVTGERSTTVPEDISLNAREATWFDLIEGLMADVDRELDATLNQVLRATFRSSIS